MDKVIFSNGMKWFRTDFHLHTIKDKEFKFTGESTDFFHQYINRLKEEDINIGIITNHNKFDRDEYCNLRKKAIKDNIWIVAGTELSVNDGANGIHCLIVFDDKKWIAEEDYINQFLTSAFEGISNRENENTRCNYNIETLLRKLDEYRKKGKDSFIILAHAEQKNGFFMELDGGRIKQIANTDLFRMSVLAIQKMRSFDTSKYNQWISKLPVFVEGSDCKSIEDVGKAPIQNGKEMKTFVKIGDFNFEALKYALSNPEQRVDTIPHPVNNSYIKSVHFEGGKLDGQTISFSPELNCLIGIRGSGKSSIIEIIRYALNIPLQYSSADNKYKDNLISYILGSGGKVVITVVDKHGKVFRIERIYGQKEIIFDANNEIKDCTVDAIFDTPVYFGQKDLSNKNDSFEYDLVNRLIGNRLKVLRNQIDDKERDVKNIILDIQKTRNLKDLKEETKNIKKDAVQKLSSFKDKGVETKLKLQTQFESDMVILNKNRETLKSYIDELNMIIQNYNTFFSRKILGSETNSDIFVKANVALEKAKYEFDKLNSIYNDTLSYITEFDSAKSELEKKNEEMQEDFAKIKRELNSETLNPDVFLALNRTINTSNLKLQEIEKLEKAQKELWDKLLIEINSLNELWRNEFTTLESETNRINEANGLLKIEILFKGQRNKFKEKLSDVFRGTGIRRSTIDKLTDKYSDFIEIYRDMNNLKDIINESQIGSFNQRFYECLAELLTYRVEDKVIIKYKEKTLDKHSLGQRASALILFLLAQKDMDILIIDQPEDDLDNQTIYDEVIKELLKLKGDMQFIFATHNANIPVLGDSENVVSCDFSNSDKISIVSGTIDNPLIQNNIVRIMEGGEEAFSKRKDIYNLWKK